MITICLTLCAYLQLRLEDLSASRTASAVQPLQDSIKSASSSVSIPNLSHQVQTPAVLTSHGHCRHNSTSGPAISSCLYALSHICTVLQGSEAFGSSLVKHFQGKAATTQTAGTYSATPQENEDAAEMVQRLSNDKTAGPKVLVVCGGASSSLENELETVANFSKALQAVFGSHVTAYVSDMFLQVCHRHKSMLSV